MLRANNSRCSCKLTPTVRTGAACRASWLAVSIWIGDAAMAKALVAGAKKRQWTNGTVAGDMPYQVMTTLLCG